MVAQLCDPSLACAIWYRGFGYHLIQALEAHIHVYTYFVYGESDLLGVGDNGKFNVIWHVC